MITPETFKARFPEFTPVSDTLIQLIITEQASQVGETWLEADRDPALGYLVAHILTLEGEPQRSVTLAAGGSGGADAPRVKRRKVGDVEVEFFDSSTSSSVGGGSASGSMYDITRYGRMFLMYAQRNFPAIAVV